MHRTASILTAAVLLFAANLPAEELEPYEHYARGVHAYFSGSVFQAHESLTAAIEAGSRDPRAYYFRGLTDQMLGRPSEAEADFQRGAELEHADAVDVYPVDRSLERVQGWQRVAIERHRRRALAEASQEIILERERRIHTAHRARQEVGASNEALLEAPTEFDNFSPPAAPAVKGEVDQPFNIEERPLAPAAAEPRADLLLKPPADNAPAPQEGGSGRAIGNALRRAFGGLLPDVPEVPFGQQESAPQ
jgi:hypothetical protein